MRNGIGRALGIAAASILLCSAASALNLNYGKVTASAGLNLRSAPSSESSVLATLPAATQVVVQTRSGSFYQVNFNGVCGYVACDFLSLGEYPQAGLVTGVSELVLYDSCSILGKTISQIPQGEPIEIYDQRNHFYKVLYQGNIGWVNCDYVALDSSLLETITSTAIAPTASTSAGTTTSTVETADQITAEQAEEPQPICYGVVTAASGLKLRSGPSTSSDQLALIPGGTRLTLTGDAVDGWYPVTYNGVAGYVSGEYLYRTTDPDTALSSTDAQALLDYAASFLGVPYVYGGESPSGFDCSGFVQYVFAHFGYDLPRTGTQQSQCQYAVPVSKSELKPGDLVFFASPSTSSIAHVGIYAGNGLFIHSSSPGDVVKYDKMSSNYYSTYYLKAVRILG